MNFPDNLRYTEDHEWVRIEEHLVVVGVTEHAQQALGDIVFVEIETAGKTLEQGAVFGTIEAVKTVSDLFMPIAGKVHAINEDLADAPENINRDPYESGWIVKIEPNDLTDLDDLLDAAAYEKTVT